jgi:hypothetical protein
MLKSSLFLYFRHVYAIQTAKIFIISLLQTCLRHPDCDSAKHNRDCVFKQMRQALNMIHFIVTDGGCSQMNGHTSPITNGDSGIGLDNVHPLASKALKDLEVNIK